MKKIDFSELIIPTLEILYDTKEEISIKQIDELMRNKLQSKNVDFDIKHGETNRTEFSYRAAWARTYLKKYGLINNSERGFWKISENYDGKELSSSIIVKAVRHNQIYTPENKEFGEIDFAENNKKFIKELSNKYFKHKITLFLGAGVSMAANMPSWEKLISRFLIGRICSESEGQISGSVKKELTNLAIMNSEQSPITQTRFISQNIEPETYLRLLIEAVYQSEANINNELFGALVDFIRKNNEIYVKDIVTFNFDNLIEQKCEQKFISYKKFSGYEEVKDSEVVKIYHVHGYLDKDILPDEVDLDGIIFSEEQYHKIYNDPYNWSNIIQVNALREKVCLFIGCSLSDPNMRRLLDISRSDKEVKHYAIMKKEEIKMPKSIDKDGMAFKKYQSFHMQNRNIYFNSLGINVIWVDDYDEIPQVLHKINQQNIE